MFLSTHIDRLLRHYDIRVACAGLDSFAALNIMDHMACLAALGHTVIATLHQPRTAIWDMIHKVPAAARCCSMPNMSKPNETDVKENHWCLELRMRASVQDVVNTQV